MEMTIQLYMLNPFIGKCADSTMKYKSAEI